jgi:hypothetical protein
MGLLEPFLTLLTETGGHDLPAVAQKFVFTQAHTSSVVVGHALPTEEIGAYTVS